MNRTEDMTGGAIDSGSGGTYVPFQEHCLLAEVGLDSLFRRADRQ
ncbi:hypothetical protein OIB37_35600 [Streptomyces sp. NBC_00820]|nr:hypothetical protein OIB37_35600 [Streptomyces sp. NBC_00820]